MSAKQEQAERLLSWAMLVVGIVGFLVSFPLWLTGQLDDRAMLGITLVLSWAALWYSAMIAILSARHARQRRIG